MEEQKKIRQLDDYEKFLWFPDQKNSFNQSLVFGFDKGYLETEKLRSSLKTVQRKFPILNVIIKGKKNPYYERFPFSEKEAISLKVRKNCEWESEVEKELHKPFPQKKGSLIRVRFISNNNEDILILTSHHLITDGNSLMYFAKELMDLVFNQKGSSVENFSEPNAFPAPLSFYSKQQQQPPTKLIFNTTADIRNCPIETKKLSTGILFGNIKKKLYNDILSVCKKKNTKVHSFLTSALFFSFVDFIKHSNNCSEKKVIYECPVNLRNLAAPLIPIEGLGCFMSTLCFEKNINNSESFWEFAKTITNDLNKELKQELFSKTLISTKALVESSRSFSQLKANRRPRYPFFGLSNLGKLNFLEKHAEKIKFVYPSVALHGTFYEKENIYLAVNTLEEQLFFSLMFPQPIMKKSEAKRIISKFLEIVNQESQEPLAIEKLKKFKKSA